MSKRIDIRALRIATGLSLRQVADETGLTPTRIGEIERRECELNKATKDELVRFLKTRRLSDSELKRLIHKGAEDARLLDKNIREQFTLGAEANLRLDAKITK